ncbi:ABC transporter substrate-binding protein [Actinacidiphila reveromycinica]|uniref:ABC transporter substrate-binding protein n=1 Tax=Actinacidiphila reveromycinica TaxID=659352 RepID=UPI001920D720|nr:ABC transporter substrate-binding protein [Streptomyces sp. SN-593]
MNATVVAAPRRRLRFRALLAAGCATALAALAACGSQSGGGAGGGDASVDISTVKAPILSGLSGAERTRVATLIAQAKSEKSFTWVDSVVAPTTASAMITEFQKEYGLTFKPTFERLTSGDLSTRIQQEVTAQNFKTDFFGVASPRLFSTLKQAGALLKYSSPESSHYTYASKYVSEQPGYWIAPVAYSFGVIVNPALYPTPITSWKQLSDPALKGKWDVANVSANEGSLYWYYGLKQVLPKSTFESWAANGPTTSSGSSAQEAQKVAEKQVDATVTSGFRASQIVSQTKVPLKVYYPSEGTVLNGQTYAIPSGAPDQAIAKLFDDFLLSKAGEQIYVDKEGIASFYQGVTAPAADLAYQPSIASMTILPVNTDKISTSQLDDARNSWKSIFSR